MTLCLVVEQYFTVLTQLDKLFWCLGCHILLPEHPFQILTCAIWGNFSICLAPLGIKTQTLAVTKFV